jgi:hypothetical protein
VIAGSESGKVPTGCGLRLLALDFPAGLRAKSVRCEVEALLLAILDGVDVIWLHYHRLRVAGLTRARPESVR